MRLYTTLSQSDKDSILKFGKKRAVSDGDKCTFKPKTNVRVFGKSVESKIDHYNSKENHESKKCGNQSSTAMKKNEKEIIHRDQHIGRAAPSHRTPVSKNRDQATKGNRAQT